MSIYTDIPLTWWEYVLAIITTVVLMWLALRATRKAERRHEAALRARDPARQATADSKPRPAAPAKDKR